MITAVGKTKLMAYVRKNGFDVYRDEMIEISNTGKGSINDNDLLSVFYAEIEKYLSGSCEYSESSLLRYINALNATIIGSRELKEVYIDKVLVLDKFYDSCVSEGKIEDSKQVRDMIISLIKSLKKSYEIKDEKDLSKYVEIVKELEGKIASLNQSLTVEKTRVKELSDGIKKLERESSKKDISIKDSKDLVDSKNLEIEELKKKIDELNSSIEELNKSLSDREECVLDKDKIIEVLQSEIKSLGETIERIGNTTKEYLSKIKDLESKISYLDGLVEGYKVKESEEEFDKRLSDFVLSKLLERNYTIAELIDVCKKNGFDIEEYLLYRKLMDINKVVNIVDNRNIVMPRLYGVNEPIVVTNSSINIGTSSRCIDLVAISDLHIKNVNRELVRRMDCVYNYAASVGVSNIVDLGDLFHLWDATELSKMDGYYETRKLIEKIASDMPFDSSITHSILGGNHDRSLLRFGIDPIKELVGLRSDYLYLGYDMATVNVGKDRIMLHHIVGKYEDCFVDGSKGNKELLGYISSNHEKSGNNSVYVDLLGHMHTCGIDMSSGIFTVPSLTHDRVNEGATHVKIYLDDKGKIKHVVFMPLVFSDNKLIKVCDISYQKTK